MIESELDMLFEYIDLQITAKLLQHNNLGIDQKIVNDLNDHSAAIRYKLLTHARTKFEKVTKILDNIGKANNDE